MNSSSASTLYGRGVFTTIAIFDSTPFLWDKHWRRLTENAAKLEIDVSQYNERSVVELLSAEIDAIGIRTGRARITFSDESPSSVWGGESEKKTSLSILVAKRREIPSNFKLTVSPHRINTTSPLVGIKSCNYLEPLMAFDDAKTRGFHEAIRLNERGEVVSGCMANLFWSKDGRLFTPSLKTGCLGGTTREFVLENLECEEVETEIEAIQSADAVFLTSAGIGVVEVREFEGKLNSESDHPILSVMPQNN